VAVHAYGQIEVIEDLNTLREIVQQTVDFYEKAMPRPRSFHGDGLYAERMLGQIVGLRIEIQKLEGKWKLNQNHPADRRKRVVQALREQGGENALMIADLMQGMFGPED
jgi:transcriptional regulator